MSAGELSLFNALLVTGAVLIVVVVSMILLYLAYLWITKRQ